MQNCVPKEKKMIEKEQNEFKYINLTGQVQDYMQMNVLSDKTKSLI